ncbi:MAG: leucine-rich repeat protein [Clostridium sp.]|nr:leucine-rich repeat protein [Clostridium sp.]
MIDQDAFNSTSIKNVTIPKSVKKIRPYSFMGSTLETVKMVDYSVT